MSIYETYEQLADEMCAMAAADVVPYPVREVWGPLWSKALRAYVPTKLGLRYIIEAYVGPCRVKLHAPPTRDGLRERAAKLRKHANTRPTSKPAPNTGTHARSASASCIGWLKAGDEGDAYQLAVAAGVPHAFAVMDGDCAPALIIGKMITEGIILGQFRHPKSGALVWTTTHVASGMGVNGNAPNGRHTAASAEKGYRDNAHKITPELAQPYIEAVGGFEGLERAFKLKWCLA